MKRPSLLLAGLLIGFLGTVSLRIKTAEGDSPLQQETLKGLPGVMVFVGTSTCEPYGLRSYQVKTDTEVQLRLAGIRILKTPSAATLRVIAGCYQVPPSSGIDTIAFYYSVNLDQLIPWGVSSELRVRTWNSTEAVGTSPKARLDEYVRNGMRDALNEFINDWLSVNPIK